MTNIEILLRIRMTCIKYSWLLKYRYESSMYQLRKRLMSKKDRIVKVERCRDGVEAGPESLPDDSRRLGRRVDVWIDGRRVTHGTWVQLWT